MSTDATTTDGFRVGRRVRVIEGRDKGRDGEIREKHAYWPQSWWIMFEHPLSRQPYAEHNLELLPEPDAPATPEPTPADEHEVVLKHMAEASAIVRRWPKWKQELLGGTAQSPTDEPPKPSYYAHLREAGCEPFKVIRGAHSRDWAIGYHVGTAEAYLLRCQRKHDSPDDDIRKAHAHLAEAVAILDGKLN